MFFQIKGKDLYTEWMWKKFIYVKQTYEWDFSACSDSTLCGIITYFWYCEKFTCDKVIYKQANQREHLKITIHFYNQMKLTF